MAKQKYWNGTVWEIVGTDADKVSIKDTSNLFTSSDVEGALKELFTNVSSGKTGIATAITDKGVSASGSDTFSQLASKIGSISTGKKWASGTATSSGYKVTITGLSFVPEFIILSLKSPDATFNFDVTVFTLEDKFPSYYNGPYYHEVSVYQQQRGAFTAKYGLPTKPSFAPPYIIDVWGYDMIYNFWAYGE